MNRLILLISLFSASVSSFADDECTRADPEAIVISSHPEIAFYKVDTNDDGHLVEHVELKSGQKLLISQYGCAHFWLSYKFKVAKDFNENLIIAARKYLKLVSEIAPTFSRFLSKDLDKIPDNFPTPELITLEPGYDWIYLVTKNEGEEHYFIITYDIAL